MVAQLLRSRRLHRSPRLRSQQPTAMLQRISPQPLRLPLLPVPTAATTLLQMVPLLTQLLMPMVLMLLRVRGMRAPGLMLQIQTQ